VCTTEADEWRGFCTSCGSYQSSFELADGMDPQSSPPPPTAAAPITTS